jgi:serine/threonine protein kinase
MQIDERLHSLLDRWVIEAEAGRLLTGAELCGDCPELLSELDREITVLRQFHILARPIASTSFDGRAPEGTASDEPDLDGPLAPLPGPGTKFGRYQIVAELGKGGMGIVYKARDTQLNRAVALKVIRPEVTAKPNSSDRFLSEARALAAIHHDHVVEIYDYGETDGARFLTMPMLAGESLESRLGHQRQLPPTEVVRIGTELAEGLAAVHEKGLIHRDLKPSNVWLEAPNGRVKLLDLGLARDTGTGDRLTGTGAIVGTPAYMSPEQVNGLDLDPRSDLFSLGSVIYNTATGKAPFAAKTRTAILKAVGETNPPPARTINPDVSPGLSDFIEWLHRKNPAERPASAAEVVKAMRGLAAAAETPTTEMQCDSNPDSGNLGKGNESSHRKRIRASFASRWLRFRIDVAFALGLVLVLGTVIYTAVTLSQRRDPLPEVKVPNAPPPELIEPLRIRAVEVLHAKAIDDKKTLARCTLGKDSFDASTDDDIKVTARLTRPAYCYLIVFRPDGKDEVLYPQTASDLPELTDEPRYPSSDRSKVYGLSDGNGGLWLVALVASDKPLPAYADWRNHHSGGPWKKVEGKPSVVWFDDGEWLEEATPGGVRTRGERGEKKVAHGVPIVDVVDWLKVQTGGVVSAVAFTVEAKK